MNEKHVNKLNHLQILLKWKLEDEEKKKEIVIAVLSR